MSQTPSFSIPSPWDGVQVGGHCRIPELVEMAEPVSPDTPTFQSHTTPSIPWQLWGLGGQVRISVRKQILITLPLVMLAGSSGQAHRWAGIGVGEY